MKCAADHESPDLDTARARSGRVKAAQRGDENGQPEQIREADPEAHPSRH